MKTFYLYCLQGSVTKLLGPDEDGKAIKAWFSLLWPQLVTDSGTVWAD